MYLLVMQMDDFALYRIRQHGKDFHQILKYMQNKFKKKTDPSIPNLTKNQVSPTLDTLQSHYLGLDWVIHT